MAVNILRSGPQVPLKYPKLHRARHNYVTCRIPAALNDPLEVRMISESSHPPVRAIIKWARPECQILLTLSCWMLTLRNRCLVCVVWFQRSIFLPKNKVRQSCIPVKCFSIYHPCLKGYIGCIWMYLNIYLYIKYLNTYIFAFKYTHTFG